MNMLSESSRRNRMRRLLSSMTILGLLMSASLCNSVAVAAACLPLDLPSELEFGGANSTFAIYGALTPQIGGAGNDFFDAQFFDGAIGVTGDVALGVGDNANYATCTHCLLLCVDAVEEMCEKHFFADQGTLRLLTAPGEEVLEFEILNWRFVEVTIDSNDGVSTPVPGGDCYSEGTGAIFANGFENL